MKKTPNKKKFFLITGLLLIVVGLAYFPYSQYIQRTRFGVIREDLLLEIPAKDLPAGVLYITEDRRLYERGKMTLVIPSIDVLTPVGESTAPAGLKQMPGLYEFSQLPGEGDVNVSIAGHRDIHDKVFYSLDKIRESSYAYLIYEGTVYRYLYKDTKIVKPTQWEVIEPQGFSCLTLTTCDPIGTSLNRMILRAELIDYEPFSEQYAFLPGDENSGQMTG